MTRKTFFIAFPIAAVMLGVGIILLGTSPLSKVPDITLEPSEAAVKYYSRLDGALVKNKTEQNRQAAGVMVDNHPDSKPQSGLDNAAIVYEVPAEGGTTRFLAMYDSKASVPEVGPVRSARAYFLDWLEEYGDALYMHSGGSPESLQLIKQYKIFDANEFAWGAYYWRANDRLAPHNLYTSSSLWQKIIAARAPATLNTNWTSWKYARSVGALKRSGLHKEISLVYNAGYKVSWQFDAKAKNYVRYVNGEKAVTKSGAEIRAHNILVQQAVMRVTDEEGRLAITTIGSGEAQVFKKGEAVTGTWKKDTRESRTRFYDGKNMEIALVPGKTWVEVAPIGTVVEITK